MSGSSAAECYNMMIDNLFFSTYSPPAQEGQRSFRELFHGFSVLRSKFASDPPSDKEKNDTIGDREKPNREIEEVFGQHGDGRRGVK